MFIGPPGTGKTMTAGIMAHELRLELLQIDLAAVISKYIGETEKQLGRVFDEAEGSGAVLFFDEADALFGKRSEVRDSHDRYANVETSYLLQRIDAYEGMVILATNFSRNLDEAFLRRFQFIVEFTAPAEAERRRIWEGIWPGDVPRAPGLDLDFMAKRFELSGGHIRNIAVAAAFLAAAQGTHVDQHHLLHATKREYQKLGRRIDDALFRH
jgi:SpoVK/Ycf46/Vps4 family AAA+-type ATPase